MVRSEPQNTNLVNEGTDSVLLASGRDALHWIIRSLGLSAGERVLLPAYICEDVVKPFLENGLAVEFYQVDANLQADNPDLAWKLSKNTKLILYINYFGFDFKLPKDTMPEGSDTALIIEDASHSFLSSFTSSGLPGDIRFASYRKLLPVPNGAVVSWNVDRIQDLNPTGTRRSMRFFITVACRSTGAALKNSGKRIPKIYPKKIHRWLFSLSETLLGSYPKPAGISVLSKNVLSNLDFEAIIRVRRQNFRFLLDGLLGISDLQPLYRSLPEEVCPLGFPILVDNRDRLVRYLAENRVFAPIHWDLPESVDKQEFSEAWSLSSKILTIPMDQRYGLDDMARIVDLVRGFQESEL